MISGKPGLKVMEILRELDYASRRFAEGLCSCATFTCMSMELGGPPAKPQATS